MADDYFSGFGGGDALAQAMRLAMAPNRLSGGQADTQDVIGAIPSPPPSEGLLAALRDKAMRGNVGATNLLAQDQQAKANAPWWSSEGLAAAKPNALGQGLSKIPAELMFLSNFLGPKAPRLPNPIKAYHGSPHDFDKFDLSKIGSGEGAQAYGHGLYFAEKEGVARSYRDALGGNRLKDGTPFNDRDPAHWAADAMQRAGGDRAKALEVLSADMTPDLKMHEGGHYQRLLRARTLLEQGAAVPEMGAGKMYEVGIHATPDQFLDWDKPLSQQSEAVRMAIVQHAEALQANPQAQGPRRAGKHVSMSRVETDQPLSQHVLGLGEYLGHDKLSASLSASGIPGIRYLDQGSRGAGQGTSNFVVFSPEIIEILRKYGLAGSLGAGALANALSDNKDSQ